MLDGLGKNDDVGAFVRDRKWFLEIYMLAGQRTKLVLLGKEVVKLNLCSGFVKKIGDVPAAGGKVDDALAFQFVIARSVLLKELYGVVAGMWYLH